jgi:adenosylcobinamide kinase / adenosylcobinamide-phosphate guanylyltransferase
MPERAAAEHEGLNIATSELITGGQKSGKSARAESLARHWLAASPQHRAVLLATARANDAEMAQRIARHRADRERDCPALQCVEEPLQLAQAIAQHSEPDTLVLVDCLTLWLTNRLWPGDAQPPESGGAAVHDAAPAALAELAQAIAMARGPLVLVSNEIGQGVIPLGPEVRAFVDALGQVNQAAARSCARVTWMVAGLPVRVKGT